jgi:ankyrin repeat protein
VIELLLQSHNFETGYMATDVAMLLSVAARNGSKAVCSRLLQLGNVDVNCKDTYGRTPLSLAAGSGRTAIVQMLLDQDGVDVNSRDSTGQTPLFVAVLEGHKETVHLLLSRDGIKADLKDDRGLTPLLVAAMVTAYGFRPYPDVIMRLLLARNDVEANSRSGSGRTPLLLILSSAKIFRTSLPADTQAVRCSMDVLEVADVDEQWPIEVVQVQGPIKAVRLLLQRDDVDAFAVDRTGRDALSYAEEYGWKEIADLLRSRQPSSARLIPAPN